MRLEAGQERSGVVDSLDEGMDGVTVCSNTCDDHRTVLVLESLRFTDTSCTTRYGLVVDAGGVIAGEGNILHTVTVLSMVGRELLVVRVKW